MRTAFRDRFHAGQLLAMELAHYADRPDVLILALPPDGVPVGFEVARALQAPLDVFVLQALVSGAEPPVELGAIATGGVVVLDCAAGSGGVEALGDVIARGREELERRERMYRGDRPRHDLTARTVVLVDDQLSPSSRLRSAVTALRHHAPLRLVVAVPAASEAPRRELHGMVDDLVCLAPLRPDQGPASWYDDPSPTRDEQVRELLELSVELSEVA